MATIYDVAAEANVSPKTVSRVMNGDAPVSSETREAVEAAISRLGYVPSVAARAMRSNRSGLIGLVTGAISHAPLAAEPLGLPEIFIVQGIQKQIEASGKTLLISDTGGRSERVPHLIRTFMEHRVEGIIYIADHHKRVRLPPIPSSVNVILVNCFDDSGTPSVLPDDLEGQRALVAALIEHGHRRIGYLTLSQHLVATALRVEGYRLALEAAGIEFDQKLIACGDDHTGSMNPQEMWALVRQMLSLADPPTVICCGNDRMAMRLYGLIRAAGLAVPEQLSVAGYDDYQLISETLFPPLTTMKLSYETMGRRGAERLLEQIDKKAASTNAAGAELVKGDVVWRQSVTDRRTTDA